METKRVANSNIEALKDVYDFFMIKWITWL
jgi:uncharacterized protein YfkK (UPF0435 family)